VTEPVWLPIAIVERIHERQLAVHCGASGVRGQGLSRARSPGLKTPGIMARQISASWRRFTALASLKITLS